MSREKKFNWKKFLAILILILGIAAIAAGIIVNVMKDNEIAASVNHDVDFLLEYSEFKREDSEDVYWNFIDTGDGMLTNNNYEDVYAFTWAIEDGLLKMETEWKYTLTDEFTYVIDEEEKTITLTRTETDTPIVFKATGNGSSSCGDVVTDDEEDSEADSDVDSSEETEDSEE